MLTKTQFMNGIDKLRKKGYEFSVSQEKTLYENAQELEEEVWGKICNSLGWTPDVNAFTRRPGTYDIVGNLIGLIEEENLKRCIE